MFKIFKPKQKQTQDHAHQIDEKHEESEESESTTLQESKKIKESHGSNDVCCGSCGGQ